MIAKTTRIMEEAFKAHNWNYNIDEHPSGKNSALITGFDLKSGRPVQIFFISTEMETGSDLAIRIFQYMAIPQGKMEAAAAACNAANGKYRFARFVSRENGYITIEMDMPAETQNVAAVAIELLYRLLDIADTAYPDFERALA